MEMRVSSKVLPHHHPLAVHAIRVTMHTLGYFFESNTRSGNHVSIYLIVGKNQSAQLNMTKARPTDTLGTYTEKYCPYIDSKSSVHDFDLQATKGLTVHDILNRIHEKGLHHYQLAPVVLDAGSGCKCPKSYAGLLTKRCLQQICHRRLQFSGINRPLEPSQCGSGWHRIGV